MENVAEALLILVLLASPQEAELADQLAADLRERGGERVTVVVGKAAEARLQEQGIGQADLLAAPTIGAQLTKAMPDLAVIHLHKRVVRGDVDLDARVWFEGRSERVGGIAGQGGDVFPFLRRGIHELLGHRFADGEVEAIRTADVASLVKRQAWPQVLARLAEQEELSAKDHYYRVLAYSRIGQRAAAVEAFAAMKEAFGQHFLVAAAQSELPAAKLESDDEPDWGGSSLVDPPAEDVAADGETVEASGKAGAAPEDEEAAAEAEAAATTAD